MAEQLPDSAKAAASRRANALRLTASLALAGWLLGGSSALADTTPPTKPSVTDDGDYTTSTTQLHAVWTSSDPESPITDCQYQIRQDSTSGTVIVNWTSTGTAMQVTRTGLSLASGKQGQKYYFAVKTRNSGGLWSSIGYSNGITVDTTPPSTPGMPTEGSSSSTDLDWDGDGGYTVYWPKSDDAQSGISVYELQEKAGAAGAWATISDNSNTASKSVSGRAHDVTYFYRVRARNRAGLWGNWSPISDGMRVDATVPSTPGVTDDGGFTTSTTQLHASWTSSDPESGITGYEYRIVKGSPSGSGIISWTSTGTGAEVTRTGLTLTAGEKYFFLVRATNGAGKVSRNGTSDGILVTNSSPPTITSVTPAADSEFYPPAGIPSSITATDPDGDALTYRFLVDGQVVQDWSASSTCTVSTSSMTAGVHTLRGEARDPWDGEDTQSVDFCLFRKPLEARE